MIADLVVVAIICGYAVVGMRQGIVLAGLATGGFLAGALVGIALAPRVASGMAAGPAKTLVILGIVLAGAWGGQVGGSLVGVRLRRAMRDSPARSVDQGLGLVAATVTVSLVLWFMAGAIAASPMTGLAGQIGRSRVLAGIDRLVPERVSVLAEGLRGSLSDNAFPRVFSGLGGVVADADPPDPAVLASEGARAARRHAVKITGEAPSCGKQLEGSGVVIAPGRVATNAHVVAGVERPLVQPGGEGTRYRATVVAFDPARDVAVLDVPGLPTPAIRTGRPLGSGDQGIVAGFPNNGPFEAVPARVRRVLQATGDDIYGGGGARRQVFELYADIEPGNSGGPLVTTEGEMVGLVFARSQTDRDTGYATTLREIEPILRQGIIAQDPVGVTRCAG
ncbi:MAG: MarP family serine protease [Kineosporiaceae bacterium]